jgi:hypothetical protein
MEENEMLEQTNETENVETQTTEENEEGIELTDTTDAGEVNATSTDNETTEVKKTLRDLLRENPEYQEEYNSMLKTRLDREDKKHQKELSKYRDTENVLRTTLNLKDGDDTNAKLREYYEAEGVKLPEAIKPGLSSGEIEAIAKYNANLIIESGTEEMNKEANRLANIGYNNLNESEKIIFNTLCERLTEDKNKEELLKIGASEDLLKDKSFVDFKSKFNSNVPMKEIYEMYVSKNNKKTVKENPGSMKNSDVSLVKDYYTDEEIAKLTDEQLDDPKIWEAVRKSQTKNYKGGYFD